MNVIGSLSRVVPILLLIAMGMVFRRNRFLKTETVMDLKKLVMNITLPALLFTSFYTMHLEGRYLIVMLSVFSACALMLAIGILAKKLMRQSNPFFPVLFTGFEAGMLAYSLFIPVFGAENTQMVALVQIGQTLFVFFVVITYMTKADGISVSAGQLLLSFVRTPVILSVLLGILVSVSGLGGLMASNMAAGIILEWIRLLSTLTVPLIVLVIGYDLKFDWKSLDQLRLPLLVCLIRLTLMVLLAITLNTLVIDQILHLGRTFQAALYTIFLLPPPFVLPFYMRNASETQRQFVLTTISVHIVLSLAAYIVFIVIF